MRNLELTQNDMHSDFASSYSLEASKNRSRISFAFNRGLSSFFDSEKFNSNFVIFPLSELKKKKKLTLTN